MRYVLGPRAVGVRARVVAASGGATAAAPAWLVVALVAQLGLASRSLTIGLAIAIGVLALVRAILVYRRARERLAALAIEVEGEDLTLRTGSAETRVPSRAITHVREIEGAHGGLRVELSGPALPPQFEVPRGGEAFVELRGWLAARSPVTRTPRRGRAARFALGAAVVLGLFFVPFVVADARGSRLAVALVLVAAWGTMRAMTARA